VDDRFVYNREIGALLQAAIEEHPSREVLRSAQNIQGMIRSSVCMPLPVWQQKHVSQNPAEISGEESSDTDDIDESFDLPPKATWGTLFPPGPPESVSLVVHATMPIDDLSWVSDATRFDMPMQASVRLGSRGEVPLQTLASALTRSIH
jgi:hypothetical protein